MPRAEVGNGLTKCSRKAAGETGDHDPSRSNYITTHLAEGGNPTGFHDFTWLA
jgi:hypothetical protein